MSSSFKPIEVYLEIGEKRTFAGAVDWPGWCRMGRDEESALQTLLAYGPRYARILNQSELAFEPPADLAGFAVVEHLTGDKGTDFGVPSIPLPGDAQPIDTASLQRYEKLLKAYWRAFDAEVEAASARPLRTGPRGGGRELTAIVKHLIVGDQRYLERVAWKVKPGDSEDLSAELDETRRAILGALAAAARGDLPTQRPRGGKMWAPRYFIRRLAWHTLDHLWEIEDRAN